jgi:hypothetical protein
MKPRLAILALGISMIGWLGLTAGPASAYGGWVFVNDRYQCASWYYPEQDESACAYTDYAVHYSMKYGPLPNGRLRYVIGPVTGASAINGAKGIGLPTGMHLVGTYKIYSTSGSLIYSGALDLNDDCGFAVAQSGLDFTGSRCSTAAVSIYTTAYPPGSMKVTLSWPAKDVTPNGFIYTVNVSLR